MMNKIPMESAKLFYHKTSNKSSTELMHSKNIASHTHTKSSPSFMLYLISPESKLEILSVLTFPFSSQSLKLKTILSDELGRPAH